MKYFNKLKKYIGEDVTKFPGSDDVDRQANAAVAALNQQQRDKELRDKLKPSGEMGDQQHGDHGIPASTTGKFTGMMNTLKSYGKIATDGAYAGPVENDMYEDERGNVRKFKGVTTGVKTGDPYHFEIKHLDQPTNSIVTLYGKAPGKTEGQPILLKVKDIQKRGGDSEPDADIQPMPKLKQVSEAKSSNEDVANQFVKMLGLDPGTEIDQKYPIEPPKIPKNIYGHPKVQALIQRFKMMNDMDKRVKIGGNYGYLINKIPGDKKSMLKLVRKIHRAFVPKIIFTPEFKEEFDKEYGEGAAAAVGAGAVGLAAFESGVGVNADAQGVIDAFGSHLKYGAPPGYTHSPGQPSKQPYPYPDDDEDESPKPSQEEPDGETDDDTIEFPNQKPGDSDETGDDTPSYVGSDGKIGGLNLGRPAKRLPSPPKQETPPETPPAVDFDPNAGGSTDVVPFEPNDDGGERKVAEEGMFDAIGKLVGTGTKMFRKLKNQSGKWVETKLDDFLRGYSEKTGRTFTADDIKEILRLSMSKIKRAIKGGHKWATSGHHDGSSYNTHSGSENNPYSLSTEPEITHAEPETTQPEEPEPKPTQPEQPEEQPKEQPAAGRDSTDLSDEQLQKYIMQLINGYRKCTLAKANPMDMLTAYVPPEKKEKEPEDEKEWYSSGGAKGRVSNIDIFKEADILEEADILDVLGRMANKRTKNAFKHFAGWGFWPDITESDLYVLLYETDYEARNLGPKHMWAYAGEEERKAERNKHHAAAIEARTALGEYYNINTWKGQTGELSNMSGHEQLTWRDHDDDGTIWKRPDPNNPPRGLDSMPDMYAPPAALHKYDSVLQYLARDIYTTHKINILNPGYKFRLQHFKQTGEHDPMDDSHIKQGGKMVKTNYGDKPPGPGKQGDFFDKGSTSPGQFGHELGKKLDAAKQAKQKQKDRDQQQKNSSSKKKSRKKSRKKRLEESFDSIRKLVTGN